MLPTEHMISNLVIHNLMARKMKRNELENIHGLCVKKSQLQINDYFCCLSHSVTCLIMGLELTLTMGT